MTLTILGIFFVYFIFLFFLFFIFFLFFFLFFFFFFNLFFFYFFFVGRWDFFVCLFVCCSFVVVFVLFLLLDETVLCDCGLSWVNSLLFSHPRVQDIQCRQSHDGHFLMLGPIYLNIASFDGQGTMLLAWPCCYWFYFIFISLFFVQRTVDI